MQTTYNFFNGNNLLLSYDFMKPTHHPMESVHRRQKSSQMVLKKFFDKYAQCSYHSDCIFLTFFLFFLFITYAVCCHSVGSEESNFYGVKNMGLGSTAVLLIHGLLLFMI